MRSWHNGSMKIFKTIELSGAVLFLVLAGLCFFYPRQSAEFLLRAMLLLALLSALALWWEAFRKRTGMAFLEAFGGTVIAMLLNYRVQTGYELLYILFAIYMLAYSGVFWMQFWLDRKDHSPMAKQDGWTAAGFMAFSIVLFALRKHNLDWLQYFLGVYFLLQALQIFAEKLLFRSVPSSRYYNFKNWISLPVFFIAIFPSWILRWMLHEKMKGHEIDFDQRKNDEEVNFNVWIHSGLKGVHQFGHMTLSWQGEMFSYGNYDNAEKFFFTLVGPGVFFTAPEKIYVNNSCVIEGSTIFQYGLHLSPEQIHAFEAYINNILNETYPWYSPIQEEIRQTGTADFEKYESDYACRLWYRTGCAFRKFYTGQWKYYWNMGTNCSLFAADILHKIQPDIKKSRGIITPGEFFLYFEEAFQDPSSNVITKAWHTPDYPETLFDVPD